MLRADLALISDWITPNSRVLDLGCGDGTLLHHLQTYKNISGYGLEIDAHNINQCVKKGVNVIHADLDDGLQDFANLAFDYVIMSQTLQAVKNPSQLLKDMLRVGKSGIVTFPNFGYWRCRLQLAIIGRMPISKALPEEWYDTSNIHICTFKDFETLCQKESINILQRTVVDREHHANFSMRLLPNLLGEIALYHLKH